MYTNESKVFGIDAINNYLENLFTCTPGDLPFEPEFGSRIPALVWEPCDGLTAHKFYGAVMESVNRWLRAYIRVSMRQSSFIPIPDLQAFDMSVAYVILVTGLKHTYKLRLRRSQDLFF